MNFKERTFNTKDDFLDFIQNSDFEKLKDELSKIIMQKQ